MSSPVLTDDGTFSFTLPKPGYYVLEADGQHKALHIFMERPRSFPEREGATLSYGPGVHIAGLVRLQSHDRVYIDRDAIVFGCFTGENVEDVKIFGHGVIDGRVCERVFEGCYTPLQQSCLRFHRSKGIEIDGPILMDAPCWVLACFDCEDVAIRSVKIVWLRLSQHLLGRNSRIEYHIELDRGERKNTQGNPHRVKMSIFRCTAKYDIICAIETGSILCCLPF